MWSTQDFLTTAIPNTLFPFELDSEKETKVPGRNLLEKIEKIVVETLKFLCNVLKLAGQTVTAEILKAVEVSLNWLLLNQDLKAGRIFSHIRIPGWNIQRIREFTSAIRDIVQLIAIPLGLIAVYAKQVIQSGKITTLVSPFSYVVVRTLSLEIRVMLMVRETLIVVEQLTALNPNYVKLGVSASLVMTLGLSLLHLKIASVVFGAIKEGLAIGSFVFRHGYSFLMKWRVSKEGLNTESTAISIRNDLLQNLERGCHQLYKQFEADSKKASIPQLQEKYYELHRAMYIAPNEHVLLGVVDSYLSFLNEMQSNGGTLDASIMQDISALRNRCHTLSERTHQREEQAHKVFTEYRDFLQGKLRELQDWSIACDQLPPQSRHTMKKTMDKALKVYKQLHGELQNIKFKKLSQWSEQPNGHVYIKQNVPLLKRECLLTKASEHTLNARRTAIAKQFRNIYQAKLPSH